MCALAVCPCCVARPGCVPWRCGRGVCPGCVPWLCALAVCPGCVPWLCATLAMESHLYAVRGISNLQLDFSCWRNQDDSKEEVIFPGLIAVRVKARMLLSKH